ncbi:MAG: hypothetical protein RL642_1437 [Bacteroidota bacterium]|jgi:hypothetical protein
MHYHSYLHVHNGSGKHKFNAEYRQPCRYCNEYKGSHFEFTYLNDSLVVPYCSKKCFIEDGNTLESNEYTQFVDQWIESGGRNRAIEEQQLSDKQYQERRKVDEQQEITDKNKKAKNNRLLQFVTFAIVIGGLGYYFLFYNPYSSEQMSNACDCVDNSYENNQIPADNLTPSDQKRRYECFELFKPKDFEILQDDTKEVYDLMVDACDRSK